MSPNISLALADGMENRGNATDVIPFSWYVPRNFSNPISIQEQLGETDSPMGKHSIFRLVGVV